MRLLVWHLHGSWTGSLVQGGHSYLIPRVDEGGPWGRGRCGRDWPSTAFEVRPEQLRDTEVDVVILQRPDEVELTERWLERRPGTDVPAVYVEHNAPDGHAATSRHPLADRDDIVLVHVTRFNELMWDNGIAPTTVIGHGIVDPGHRYTGELSRAAVAINEPARRQRIVGTDLLPVFARTAPIDLYGMGSDHVHVDGVTAVGDLGQAELHREMARRRLYIHTTRWTSLGLSLIEAMYLGMPVVALASTEVATAIPEGAGRVSTDAAELAHAARQLIDDPDRAYGMGTIAREHALAEYGLGTFLHNWDLLLERITS